MGKRGTREIISILLSIAMVGTSVPTQAWAEVASELRAGSQTELAETTSVDERAEATEPTSEQGKTTERGTSAADDAGIAQGATTAAAQAEGTATEAEPQPEVTEAEEPAVDTEAATSVSDYATLLSLLKVLDGYAKTYAASHSGEDATELVLNFVRTGVERYTDGNWKILAGEENTAFVSYVGEQDAANGTSVMALRGIEAMTIPSGEQMDFGHVFGTLDITYHMAKTNPTEAQSDADLGGWAGDVCDLLDFTNGKVTGTDVGAMADEIRTTYLGVDDPEGHEFSWTDVYGDLDAVYIMDGLKSGKTVSTIFSQYYNSYLTTANRAKYFLQSRFGFTSGTKDQVRKLISDAYKSNSMIATLEGSRSLTDVDDNLRLANCYAWADYLSEQAGISSGTTGNPYYTVFSQKDSTLAPGVSQSIRTATTADNKQIIYYIATADVARNDVTVQANYKDNAGGPPWGMQRVTDQMAAAKANHSDPTSDRYVANYNPVVGVNADFYDMTTGKPTGALVMEGTEYSPVGTEGFFGILDDGTAIMGDASVYEANKDHIVEAVGTNYDLVKDGKMAFTPGSDYYSNRASRTCVGITADGRVVLMVLDGRREPVSAGGSAEEMAQIMIDAGCVQAANLDGGGSTTFAAKEEGADEVTVVNNPSDGYARSVSSSLMVVSTARPSTEFDHAVVSTEYDYLAVGASQEVTTSGVSVSGESAAIPEGATLRVSDTSKGHLDGTAFVADALGDVTIELVSGDTVLGSKTLHVVQPDKVAFSKSSISAVYEQPTELPIVATYNGNPVAVTTQNVLAGYIDASGNPVTDGDIATVTGFTFTGHEASGVRTVTVGAALIVDGQPDTSTAATATVNLYKANEAIFDFSKATKGDSSLALLREVSNSTVTDGDYYLVVDPGQPMVTSYTYALDMTTIPIPDSMTELVKLLPGGDQAGATAWGFLMQLAERVSVLTNVTITLKVDPNFDVDFSGLTISNDYFKLTSATLDAATNTLTIKCNWIDQEAAIDASTANPMCILSGLKLTPKSDAAWDEKDCLTPTNTCSVAYDIYLRSSALYSLGSQESVQQKYGIYAFENPDVQYNGANEKGAHFSNTYKSLDDTYTLDKHTKNGWVLESNGKYYYYKDNVALTGYQELPDVDGTGSYWFDLGTDGASNGKVSGLFQMGDDLYFAENGVLKSGWQNQKDENGTRQYYFFNTSSYKAVDGEQTIGGYHYVFKDKKLIRGELVTRPNGDIWYMWAGSWASQTWMTIDGKQYYFRSGYQAATGIYGFNIGGTNVHYVFGKDGVWQEDLNGFYTADNGRTYLVKDGIIDKYPGLVYIDGYYYYFTYDNIAYMVKDGTYWVDKTNDLLPQGNYQFDEQGRMILSGTYTVTWKNWDGSVLEKDTYVKAGETAKYDGATPTRAADDNFSYTFKGWDKEPTGVTADVTYTAQYTKTGWLTDDKGTTYIIDDQVAYKGQIGWVDGKAYYFDEDGYLKAAGLVRYVKDDGTVNYYCFVEGGSAVTSADYEQGKDYWVSAEMTNGLLPEWGYHFDANGVIEHDADTSKNGTVKESDGNLYRYIDGIRVHVGMFEENGAIYYARSNGQLVVGQSYWCERTNGIKPVGSYEFDDQGRLVEPEVHADGIVAEDGSLFYYKDGKRYYAGLIQIDGKYYYVRTSGELAHSRKYWITKTNGLLPEASYEFDDQGVLQLPKEGIVSEEGSLYYYENGVRTHKGLFEKDGAYYYARTSGELVHGQKYWITDTNGLMAQGSYQFADDGKMVDPRPVDATKEGIVSEDGSLYYYENGVRVHKGLFQQDGAYYYARTSGELVHGRFYWITDTNGLMAQGSYQFADDGKMVVE
ncbi:MAG: phosphodiester glycosidase family protein [Olsenella sp.]|jgi:glucan-binding YG repeat protein|nr:phosphodiester glycosidase family protein [Olsenella sp.]